MTQVNMLEAKSSLSSLIKQLENGTEDMFAIARNGKPVALLTLIKPADMPRRIGVARGIKLTADDWDINEGDEEVAALFGAGR